MSQIPPGQSDGWFDPYGNHQPGFPPPGYWQASDGRWYPPNPPGTAETQVVDPSPPQAAPPSQPTFQPPSPGPAPGQAPPQPGPGQPPSQPAYGQPGPAPFASPGPTEPPGYAPGPQGAPSYAAPANFAPQASPQKKSRTALYVVLGLIAFGVFGCTAAGILIVNRAADEVDSAFTDLTSTTFALDELTETTEGIPPTGDDETSSTTARSLAGVTTSPGQGPGVGDALSCTFVDEDNIVVELVNSTSMPQTYLVTIGFFEGDQRLSDTVAFFNNLRPGERAIERALTFGQEGSRCEILETDAIPVITDPSHESDVSPCTVTGADTFGDVKAELAATNSTGGNVDYSIQVAFVDGEGIRRGTGFATIETVRPDETAPADVFTTVDDQPGLVCEVVGVTRTDS